MQDEWAVESQKREAEAVASGYLDREIIGIRVRNGFCEKGEARF